jgi:diguanylate cyclase (GGDEF)-like protein
MENSLAANEQASHFDILVVDDEESLRNILSQVLSEDGYTVTLASSGEEALRVFAKSLQPVVFTDIRMGGMSGIELMHAIKALKPETQVIIITSHASLDSSLAALRAGAYDYLIKPFEDLELISSVAYRAMEKIRLLEENRLLLGKLKEKNEELEFANRVLTDMANRDGLSGLFNHRFFQEALQTEVVRATRYSHPIGLLFLDLDFFKNYNDKNGHPEGDILLRTLAKILKESLRQTDIVARYGGEEFTMILPQTDEAAVRAIAEKLRQRVADFPFPGRHKQPGGKVTVSIGVATFPQHGTDATSLLQYADKALYQAKNGGRNQVC